MRQLPGQAINRAALFSFCVALSLAACKGSYGGTSPGPAKGSETGGVGGSTSGGGASFANEQEFFAARVQPSLSFCRSCHVPGGQADTGRGRRMMLSSSAAEDYGNLKLSWERLGKGVETNRILLKASGTDPEPHTGGAPWPKGGAQYNNARILFSCWDNPAGCASLLGDAAGAPGDPGPIAGDPTVPTYFDDVQKIVFEHCQACHTAGSSADLPLDTYPDAKANAGLMDAQVQQHLMPPWPPDPACGTSFRYPRLLSDDEIDTIHRWAVGGAPEGNVANAPSPPPAPAPLPPAEPPDGVTMDIGRDFTFGGPGAPSDLYECFRLKPPTDRDVIGAAITPGNQDVVHHIILFREPGGRSRPEGDMGPCPGIPLGGEFLVGWAPGSQPLKFDPGIGMRLAPTDAIAMQVHYHNHGAPQTDRSSARLWFSPTPVPNLATVVWGASDVFIPPGEHSSLQGQCTIIGNPQLIITAPHMHTRGTKFSAKLLRWGEPERCLIDIPHWDFEWQGGYMLTTPLQLQTGDRITTQCTWFNETDRTIMLGEGTEDEMCFDFMYMTGWNGDAFCFF